MNAQFPRSACVAHLVPFSLEAVRFYLNMLESSKSRYSVKAVEARMRIHKGREGTSLNGYGRGIRGSIDDLLCEIDGC